MRAIKYITTVLLSLLLIISPVLVALGTALLLPPAFGDSFVGALGTKLDRLASIEDEKIVVVGGSSVAFGLDSEALEAYVGMPVVNFGLYAALGTKVMLDLSLPYIGEGDIVVVAPEIDEEALSLYFGADTVWRALDGRFDALRYIDFDNAPSMLGALFGFAGSKLDYARGKLEGTDTGIYLSKYFDGYGDFDYPRENNVMKLYWEQNNPISLNTAAYDEDTLVAFFDYVNAYAEKCTERGASVYFSFSPMNAMAVSDGSDAISEFEEKIAELLDFKVISDIESCILDAGYFYDTNYHLNDAGRTVRTMRLADDIRIAARLVRPPITEPEPTPPELPEQSVRFDGIDENCKYFTFEKLDSGAYSITGLTELGKSATTLTVPLGYEGYIVQSVAEGAFSGSALESLTVTRDANLAYFDNGAFLGAGNLRHLWIYKASGDDISPPESFYGVHTDFVVHIGRNTDFSYHYYWSERGLDFVSDAN